MGSGGAEKGLGASLGGVMTGSGLACGLTTCGARDACTAARSAPAIVVGAARPVTPLSVIEPGSICIAA